MLGHEPPQNMCLASVSGTKDDLQEWKREVKEEGGKMEGGEERAVVMGGKEGELGDELAGGEVEMTKNSEILGCGNES